MLQKNLTPVIMMDRYKGHTPTSSRKELPIGLIAPSTFASPIIKLQVSVLR